MKRTLLLSFVTCLLLPFQTKAQLPPAYEARLQTVFDSVCNKYNLKGASAAVVVPGIGTWKGVHGISQAGVPVMENMLMGIGSNTKTFIAATLLKLQEQGTVDLDDTIGTWLQHPNVSGQITIRQLLNHTSGIYSFTESPAFNDSVVDDFTRVWEANEVLQFIDAPYFQPGASWEYSNSNYLIAGMIIEQVTGNTLGDVLEDLIYLPAGFNNTILYPHQITTAPIANVWSSNFNWQGNWLEDLITDYGYDNNAIFSMAWAAGAIMSTAEENAFFWSKLIKGELMNAASLTEMKEGVMLSNTADYGLGIFRYKNFNGRMIYSHGGTNLGFINENAADSISGVGISVLTNQDSISNNLVLNVVRALHKVTIAPPVTGIGGPDQAAAFTIYPNPAKHHLRIAGLAANKADLYICDMTGRVIIQEKITNNSTIDIQALPAGNYIVRMAGADGSSYGSSKLAVQR